MRLIAAVFAAVLSLALVAPVGATGADDRAPIAVIVQKLPGVGDGPEQLVERLGGTVTRGLGIINGFSAEVPASAVSALERSSGVRAVTADGQVRFESESFDASKDEGSLSTTGTLTEADWLWGRGITGAGVGVALIDTGVSPVAGLETGVLNGPDLSLDGEHEEARYLDAYGHGTHLAGIISGKDEGWTSSSDPEVFAGIAPDATLVNVKVGDAYGRADVSQVIAAIDWVVTHRDDANIRVLNLAFGTDSRQDYRADPLSYAVDVAWREGITVVTAAGNRGNDSNGLVSPAHNPRVLAVGAANYAGSRPSLHHSVPEWSSGGDGIRNPDVVAPGVSLASLRVPNSYIDIEHPSARVDERYFRGSGTSQAAAVVSGAAALLLQQRPELTPDQVKALLTGSAGQHRSHNEVVAGKGSVNVKNAARMATPTSTQSWDLANGLGSLDEARGSVRLSDADGNVLEGEVDVAGVEWDPEAYAANFASGSWSSGSWSGGSWSSGSWSSGSWSSGSWSSGSWSSGSWSSGSWSSGSWSSGSWSNDAWTSGSWSSGSWSSGSWSTGSWSSHAWGLDVVGGADELDARYGGQRPSNAGPPDTVLDTVLGAVGTAFAATRRS